MFTLERLDHIAITVRDIDASVKWYKETLGLERYYENAWGGVPTMIGKGGTCIALFKAKKENVNETPGTETIAVKHIAFRANRENFEKAQRTLKEKAVEFEFEDHEISHSIYFTDPDGYELEITTYEL